MFYTKFICSFDKNKIMTTQEKIKATVKPKGLFNVNYIEKKVGLRKYKLYEFLNDKAELTPKECKSVLDLVRNETRLQR